MTNPTLTPRLVVDGADAAIATYQRVFDAELIERYADDGGHVVHAALRIFGAVFSLAEAKEAWHNLDPRALGGSPVILHLDVPDVDAVAARLLAEPGAQTIFEVADQFYGMREGRLRDPFGHLWILSQKIEDLTPDQIQARMRGD